MLQFFSSGFLKFLKVSGTPNFQELRKFDEEKTGSNAENVNKTGKIMKYCE